ncbi:MAG TPA: hypothetical protein VJL61_04100 [Rhodanobacteraceae bacterium]|nr:hypothetical protein [Rhodanobacteraceae bacterium]
MCKHLASILALAAVLGSVAACSIRTVLKPNPQPKTSYEMLVPKGVLRYTLEPGETAVQPMPDKQVAPVYPPSLVQPDAAPVTVVAQLVMGKDGHVGGVYPVSDTAKAADHALFEAAVEHAARQWTFTPLWMQKPNSDGTFELTAKPFSLWYVFHFRIVDGKPIVETVKR